MVISQKPRKVAVIGAGILGATIAWRLARRGVHVALIDKGQPGHGASSHSFAWINAGAKEPIGYHNLNRRSLEMWPRSPPPWATTETLPASACAGAARFPGNPTLWPPKGWWPGRVNSNPGATRPRLIDARELKRLEPALDVGPVTAAEYTPNEGQVEPQMVVDACLRRLREMGCEICTDTEVFGFERHHDGRVHGLVTASGLRDADAVIIAAGTGTTSLAALAGVNVPQAESPGVVIRTNPLPPLLHNVPVLYAPALGDGRREIHIRQCADGRLMIGEGDQESLAEDDTQAHANDLLARARRYLPGIDSADAVPVPVGWRPMPLDGYPVMGFAWGPPTCMWHLPTAVSPWLRR